MKNNINTILRSKLRYKLLQHWIKQPLKKFFVRELALILREDPGNVSRELAALRKAGLLSVEQTGNLKIYSLLKESALFQDVREMLSLTQPPEKQKVVHFLAGPNGAGKSTLAQGLIKEEGLPFVNADELAAALEADNIAGVRLTAGKLFFKTLNDMFRSGKSFVVETTLAGNYWKRWIRLFKEKGYFLRMSYIFVENADEAVFRIRTRVKKGGHSVPEEDIRRRFTRSKSNFWNAYKNEMDHWQLFLNNQNKLLPVAGGSQGSLEIMNEDAFMLFKEGVV